MAHQTMALVALACGFTSGSSAAPANAQVGNEHAHAIGTVSSFEEYLAERFRPPGILCGSNQECLDSPLVASTPRELEWLRANGYPSLRELRTLRAASSDALTDEVARGSRTAMVVLGARLVRQQRLDDGVDLMRQAADGGSIYAYYELSNAFMRSRRLGDQLESASFLRLAYLLGDGKAAAVLQRRFTLGPIEHVIVEERAASLYRTFAKGRKPDMRPMDAD